MGALSAPSVGALSAPSGILEGALSAPSGRIQKGRFLEGALSAPSGILEGALSAPSGRIQKGAFRPISELRLRFAEDDDLKVVPRPPSLNQSGGAQIRQPVPDGVDSAFQFAGERLALDPDRHSVRVADHARPKVHSARYQILSVQLPVCTLRARRMNVSGCEGGLASAFGSRGCGLLYASAGAVDDCLPVAVPVD